MSEQQPPPPPGAPPPPGHQPAAAPGEPPRWGTPPPAPQWGAPPPAPGWTPGWTPGPQHPPGPTPWQPARGMLGAAHKPGAMPLRPLSLGDMYDAAFRIIRFNPKATVGSAVLVAAVSMLIPVLLTALFTFTLGAALDGSGEVGADLSTSELVGTLGSLLSLLGGMLLLQVGLVFVTGMIAHVTRAAAVGKRLGLGEAWAATRGKRWRLAGLMAVVNLIWILALGLWILTIPALAVVTDGDGLVIAYGILSGLFLVVPAMLWFWIRVYYLPAPALMLEDVGVFAAIGRGFTLTRRQYWRTFGIAVLTLLVTGVAGNLLSFPIGIVGQVVSLAVPEYAALGFVLTQALALVVSAAFVAPFTATVASLQYLDQRMRKEAYDVELMSDAGVLGS